MRVTIKIIAFFFAAIFLFPVISCTKENDALAKCKISTITLTIPGMNAVSTITYNNDGKVSTLNTSGPNPSNKVYTYFGNTIIVTGRNGSGNIVTRDSITVDDRDRPLNLRMYRLPVQWDNISFEYNGDDLQRMLTTNQSSAIPTINTATYVDGNMQRFQTGSSFFTFEYYTDKKVQPGDYLQALSLVSYGISIYPQKNLVKGGVDGQGTISNFTYEFNDDGLVTKVVATNGASVTTLTYEYQCDK